MQDNFERFKRQLPSSQDLPNLLVAFQENSVKSEVTPGTFSFTPVPRAPGTAAGPVLPLREFLIRLPIQGYFKNIGKFINEIEKHRRFMRVENVTMSATFGGGTVESAREKKDIMCTGEIQVRTFTYEAPGAAAPTGGTGPGTR